MSKIDLSTGALYLQLGSTPRMRSVRADKLFRRLRSEEEEKILRSLLKAPHRLSSLLAKTESE